MTMHRHVWPWGAFQVEHMDDAIPDRPIMECLADGHRLRQNGTTGMQRLYHALKLNTVFGQAGHTSTAHSASDSAHSSISDGPHVGNLPTA